MKHEEGKLKFKVIPLFILKIYKFTKGFLLILPLRYESVLWIKSVNEGFVYNNIEDFNCETFFLKTKKTSEKSEVF